MDRESGGPSNSRYTMSKKILLVEDEVLIAMAEAQTLKKHGYKVLTVDAADRIGAMTQEQTEFRSLGP
jgi:DNA-binding response OmpR family regulator